jgi:glycine/D-amino acid oxidase-like deaminating enzyme
MNPGARTLGGVNDINMFSARGQMVIVEAPHYPNISLSVHDQSIYSLYIIPRCNGTVVLGGTFDREK